MRSITISRLPAILYLLLPLSAVLLWPAAVNRAPFFFPDTSAYVRGADRLATLVFDRRSEWFDRNPGVTAAQAPVATAQRSVTIVADSSKPVLLGRSIYYGLVLYIGVLFHSFWWPIVAQAGVVGGAILGFVRHFVDPSETWRFITAFVATILLAAMTPLPFFVSFLMPDLFTGLAALALAALVAGWERESPPARAAWALLLVAAALFHSSNILLLAAVATGCGLVALVCRRPAILLPGTIVALAALTGFAGEKVFVATVRTVTGQAPIRPPFLTARLIADGPGYSYLTRACTTSMYRLCRYRAILPQPSDSFLWSMQPSNGVFMRASPGEQRLIAGEEGRFVLGVLRDQPFAVFASSVGNVLQQVGMADLDEFNYVADSRASLGRKLPRATLTTVQGSRAFQRTMPTSFIATLVLPFAILAIVIMAVGRGRTGTPRLKAISYGALVVFAWLTNDAICGILSTPHARYQTRIIWTLPVLAVLILLAVARDRIVANSRVGPFER